MRIVLLTQDDPFYLPDNIHYLVEHLPANNEIVGCVLFKVSPYGKRMSLFEKVLSATNIFGVSFFLHYGSLLVRNRIFNRKTVSKVLKAKAIPKIELEKSINHKSSIEIIRRFEPDLLVSVAGNQIFKSELINLAPKGCLNLHTALLPKYRGLMPSFWVLKNNEKETGVSVFFVDEGIDSGPIIVQKKVTIGNKSQQQLIKETKHLGMQAIIEAIAKIQSGNYQLLPNDRNEMTYYSFPTREDVQSFRQTGKKFF